MAFSPLTVSPNVNSRLHHFIGFLLLVEKLDNPRSIFHHQKYFPNEIQWHLLIKQAKKKGRRKKKIKISEQIVQI
jgi:hypothetical protein